MLRIALFLLTNIAVMVLLRPWVSGNPDATFLQPAAAMAGLAVAALSWPYVKHSNIAAAKALEEEVASM